MTTPIEECMPRMLDPAHVMLTGATGYIGSFLVETLMRDTGAEVHALVRAGSEQDGRERIRRSLEHYEVWDDSFAHRIHPVVGDLGQPLLGLTADEFARYARIIDAIYHNGALVNFAYPYAMLKGPNVQGTQEVVRLACLVRPKALHYMGTIDSLVAAHVPRPWLEIDPPKEPRRDAPDGYMLSKWVAENLVIAARNRGVPVTIHRPTWVIGHTRTGAAATTNFLLQQLKCYLHLRAFPENPSSDLYHGAPIDYVTRAVVHLSRQESSLGKIFHPWGPSETGFDDLYGWVADYGYDFDVVPRSRLLESLRRLPPSDPFYPLVPLMERLWSAHAQPLPGAMHDPRVECANAIRGLAGSGIECPPTDRELMHRCLSYLVRTGFIDPPPGRTAAAS